MSNEQPTILYVEDNAQSRKVMKILLKGRMGLSNINIFEDSENFLARVRQLNPIPDVVFLDIHVPPHDGFEMLQMLREIPEYRNTAIVALTASVMNEEIERLRSAGFDGCMSKPLDTDTFPQVLQRIVAGEKIWHIVS